MTTCRSLSAVVKMGRFIRSALNKSRVVESSRMECSSVHGHCPEGNALSYWQDRRQQPMQYC
eukprot:4808184-Amphidinium_carterae.1